MDVALQDGPSGTTGTDGVMAFAPVDAGTRAVTFTDGDGNSGELALSIADGDVREVAVALDGSGAAEMADLQYSFGGDVVEITSDMTVADVNDALSQSNVIVLVRGGEHPGQRNGGPGQRRDGSCARSLGRLLTNDIAGTATRGITPDRSPSRRPSPGPGPAQKLSAPPTRAITPPARFSPGT